MIKYRSNAQRQGQHGTLQAVGLVLLVVAVLLGLWIGFDRNKGGFANQKGASSAARGNVAKSGKVQEAEELEMSGGGVDEMKVSDSHRQPLQFRSKPVAPAAVLAVLASGKQTVDERVRQLQGMRGISLSNEERKSALIFLAGKEGPEGMGKGSMQWLADELLTVLRLQEPPWDGLAEELANAAFQPNTDPVVRDYIMQHLGHLWEQYGSRKEIDDTLWRAVATSDETTPGTALIALSRGYVRDGQEESLAKVRQQALTLAQNPDSPLAVRVTALSIAGDGGGEDVKRLAGELVGNPETPVILRKVAERVLR
jgi:hypothetical protein